MLAVLRVYNDSTSFPFTISIHVTQGAELVNLKIIDVIQQQ